LIEPLFPWPHRRLGDPQQPALVFLHGFLGSGQDWAVVARGCQKRFCCYLFDLPGHGPHAARPMTSALSLQGLAKELVDSLAALGQRKFSMVGYSMGARLALTVALTHGDKVEALVLESGSPGIELPADRKRRMKLDQARAERIGRNGLNAFVDRWYDAPLFASLKRTPQELNALKNQRCQNDPAWMAKVVVELSPGRQPSLWASLASVRVPCLLLAGALDEVYKKIIDKMQSVLPQANTIIVPRAGHNTHLEQPERFTQAVLDFLEHLMQQYTGLPVS